MGLGLSFGANKTKTNETTNENKTTVGQQSGTEGTNSTNTSNTTGTTNTSGTTTGTQQQNQQNSQSGTTTNQNQSTGSQTSFSSGTAGSIENSINQLLGGISGDKSTIGAAVDKLGAFDPTQFINDTVAGASQGINDNLHTQVGALFDNIGGTANSNSAAALLQGSLQNNADSAIAGVRANATGQAAQIQQGNLAGITSALSSTTGLAPALINALKGGNVTTNQTDLAKQIADLTNSTTGVNTSTEQTQQQQEQSQQTIQTLTQLITQLMNTTQHETGTSTTQGTQTKMGGGISLGL